MTDEHIGVVTLDDKKSTGVLNTEYDDTATIDAVIAEVAATLD